MRNSPVIRPATAADAAAFYGAERPMKSMRGFVAELNGDVVGVGGFYYERGYLIAFSEMKESLRPYRKAIVRGARRIMAQIIERKLPVFALANCDEPTAPQFLKGLGFTFFCHTPQGDIYKHEVT
jgi:hypothetical protein